MTRDELKKHLLELAKEHTGRMALYKDEPGPDVDALIRIFSLEMLATTYMYIGNKTAYREFKQKALEAYSETLDILMDQSDSPSDLIFPVIGPEGRTTYKNEGAVLHFGGQMREYNEMMSGLEQVADSVGLWK
jgi:hypothetical protein